MMITPLNGPTGRIYRTITFAARMTTLTSLEIEPKVKSPQQKPAMAALRRRERDLGVDDFL